MPQTFGVIVGNRGFFPAELARQGREDILSVLKAAGYGAVCLGPDDTKFGSVETRQDAQKCAALLKRNARRLNGIIVTLPNFGDERGVAETLRLADLGLPVLIQATPDDPARAAMGNRRDSFCGKISVCNNLVQYGIPFTLTEQHTVAVDSEEFRKDLDDFAAVCRVVKGMRRARVGAIGARPAAFKTVRYSEKILESYGISVETVDLSEVFAAAVRLKDGERRVKEKLAAIKGYCPTEGVARDSLLRMAKLGVAIDEFAAQNDLHAVAIQCWTSMEENYGVVPCTLMSMMSNALLPAACEVDVGGALAMLALQLASGAPSALLDWNNNYGDDPDRCILFHCSNVPKHFFESVRMDAQDIIAKTVGRDNALGTCVGRFRTGPITFARLATDDEDGSILAYVGDGELTEDPVQTFGGYGVARIEGLQELLKFVCKAGFEHHVAVNMSSCADVLDEAFTTYLGFDTYRHE